MSPAQRWRFVGVELHGGRRVAVIRDLAPRPGEPLEARVYHRGGVWRRWEVGYGDKPAGERLAACARRGLAAIDETRETCEWCGGDVVPGTTCPRSIACPTCKGKPGGPCYRPSGHKAEELHKERVRAAEQLDKAAGDGAEQLTVDGRAEPVREAESGRHEQAGLFGYTGPEVPGQLTIGGDK